MNKGHPIADEVLDLALTALAQGENWLAYNSAVYLLEKEDAFFFKTKDEATQFAIDNYSDRDSFGVISFDSVEDLLRQIPYGANIDRNLGNSPDENGLYNREGNAFTDALIDHMEGQPILFNSQ